MESSTWPAAKETRDIGPAGAAVMSHTQWAAVSTCCSETRAPEHHSELPSDAVDVSRPERWHCRSLAPQHGSPSNGQFNSKTLYLVQYSYCVGCQGLHLLSVCTQGSAVMYMPHIALMGRPSRAGSTMAFMKIPSRAGSPMAVRGKAAAACTETMVRSSVPMQPSQAPSSLMIAPFLSTSGKRLVVSIEESAPMLQTMLDQ